MKIILFANTDWYLFNFRRSLANSLRKDGHQVLLVSPDGPYGKKLQHLGFCWIKAPMKRQSLNPFSELLLLNWLRKLIIIEHIDLIHGFTIKCAIYSALASWLSDRTVSVCAVAGMGYVFSSNDFKAKILRPIVTSTMRIAMVRKKTRLILQNPDDVSFFRNSKIINPLKVRLIKGSGVNCRQFNKNGLRGPTQSTRVLLAARLLWDKGIDVYINAARQLIANGRSIQFLLAGDTDPGNPKAVPEEMVDGWVKEGVIKWLGHVDDMPALFSTIHVLALPTSYGEGLPRSLIEAAACGIALITTDAPGCREVVAHEITGLLIPPKDADALAQAIARLDDNPELILKLGAAAKEKALREFDEKIIIEQTKAVYRELVGYS